MKYRNGWGGSISSTATPVVHLGLILRGLETIVPGIILRRGFWIGGGGGQRSWGYGKIADDVMLQTIGSRLVSSRRIVLDVQ